MRYFKFANSDVWNLFENLQHQREMNAKRIDIGIDPGGSGALAVLITREDDKEDPFVYRFKNMTESEIVAQFQQVSLMASNVKVFGVLEKVNAMPGQGVSSTFKFGQAYGFVRACMYVCGMPFEVDTPQKWMKFYGMKKKKEESKTDWKRRLKEKAQQLYPDLKVTADMADALLIARYCKFNY